MNNPFFDLARDGCKQAESEIDGVECLYIGPGEHTEQEQVQIVQDLISKGVDGIAVASSNAPAMAKGCKRFWYSSDNLGFRFLRRRLWFA